MLGAAMEIPNRTLASIALLAALAAPAPAAVVTVASGGSGWQLLVDGEPFTVKGMSYGPEKVGEDPGLGTLRTWMYVDDNRNGILDSPYEAFVDVNGDGRQDRAEPPIGDFALMRDMGVNTIRIYHHPSNDPSVLAGYGGKASLLRQYNHAPDLAVLRDLFNRFGIRVAMGDFLGAYTIGSGAASTTDYNDATQRARMLASVERMARDFKDEPWLLMYVLGNENRFSNSQTNADTERVAYATLLEEAAQLIKSIDPDHPVAVSLWDNDVIDFINVLEANAPSLDILGANVYRYPAFSAFFADASNAWDKPVVFTEYGDAAAQFTGNELDEDRQVTVLDAAWTAIEASTHSIGGMAFAWLDNWWQSGAPSEHTINTPLVADFENEWHGFASQGAGVQSPFLRRLRKVYNAYQVLWTTAGRPVSAAGGRFIYPYAGSYALLDVPADAFPAGTTVTLAAAGGLPAAPGNTLDFTPTGTGVEIAASSGLQPGRSLTVYLPFAHGDGAYVLARYDAGRNRWVTLNTRRDSTGALVATTDHLSLFQVMQVSPSAAIQRVIAYPNPAMPARGHAGMNFSQIPPDSRVEIYTGAGELVRELRADVTGIAFWDLANRGGKAVASGAYLAVIEGPGGREVIRVAVQR